ncbi:MAG: hypothetical protein JWR90_234 [Marmoricola sp.]|nr:hypothetical protein [Marmoricola sp.]
MKILAAYGRLRDQILTDSDAQTAPEPERFDTAVSTSATSEADLADLLDTTKLLPAVWLFVHLADDSEATRVARAEEVGPVTAEWVRRHLGERCSFKITPVLDPLNQTPVDAYEIPARHQQAVHLMTPADTFPFASNTTRKVQNDHTIPWTAKRCAAARSSPVSGTTDR